MNSAHVAQNGVRVFSLNALHIAWAVAIAHTVTMIALPRGALLAHTFADDSFYYLEIAKRFGQPNWPTFDGVHTTTGFHPLWMMILVVLAKIIPRDPLILPRVALAISTALVLAWGPLLHRLIKPSLGEKASLIAVFFVLTASGLTRLGLLGMESPLAVAVLLLFLHELFVGKARFWAVGLLAGLTLLARLDMGIVLGLSFITYLYQNGKASLGILSKAAVTSGAVITPFFAWVYVLTGHIATSSATMKATVVAMDAQKNWGGKLSFGYAQWALKSLTEQSLAAVKTLLGSLFRGPTALVMGDLPADGSTKGHLWATFFILVLIVTVSVVIAIDLKSEQRPATPLPTVLKVLVAGSIVHLVLTAVMIPGQSDKWYWALESITGAGVIAWFAARGGLPATATRTLVTASALGTVALLLGTWVGLARGDLPAHRSFPGVMAELADEVPNMVGESEKVGSCNAGVLGWFSQKGVMNLDGLVNDFEFIEARKNRDVRSWMQKEKITWFIDCVPAHMQAGYAGVLGLHEDEIEVVRRLDGGMCEGIAWRIHWHE